MANVFSQMKDLYKMQSEAKEMQKKLKVVKIVGESNDGRVQISMNGAQEFEDIFIDDSLLSEGMLVVIKKQFQEAFKDYQKKLAKQIQSSFDVEDLKKVLGQ
jgi:DNA-binding protein YbaB